MLEPEIKLEQQQEQKIYSKIFRSYKNTKILGITGRENGHTHMNADVCLVIPPVNLSNITPHSEAFQAIIWHLLVSHPKLKVNSTKW